MHVYLQQIELGTLTHEAQATIATPLAEMVGTESPLTFPAPPVAVTAGNIATKIEQTFIRDNHFVQHRVLFRLPSMEVEITLK